MSRHDVVVVGGGPGGYATAFRASIRGLDVALVEQGQLGGTCLQRGCVPSKAILHVAGIRDELARAEVLGLEVAVGGLDGGGLAAFRDGVVTRLTKGLDQLAAHRTTRVGCRGRLVPDGDGVAVEVTAPDGTTSVLEAPHVVLATGSVPAMLPGVTIDGEVVQTSDQALWFSAAPERAVIIGGGAIGVEFASMWAPFGTQVTVVEALERLLPLEDHDSSAALTRAYRRRGIEVVTAARVQGVEVADGLAQVEMVVDGSARRLSADRVLVAVGRRPRTEDTGAAVLGILDERGAVVTDAWGATAVPGLWAVGDVRPTLALAHAAFAEGQVVADRIAGLDVPAVDHTRTPRVTYSHPEVASVGWTEAEARARYGDDGVEVTTTSLAGNAKAIIAGQDGLVKLVRRVGATPLGAPGEAGGILGVHVVGPQATELIAAATPVVTWGAVPAELATLPHAHPSVAEALGEAYLAAAGLPLHGR
jgi:dihydrolipoamide dehydrogenase